MTVMDAKKMDAPNKTRAAVNNLARMAMARHHTDALGAMHGAQIGAILGNVGVGKTSAQVHRALALYTFEQLEPSGKTRVADAAAPPAVQQRRKASPKAVALLERFKDVPSVDPHRFREDVDRVLDPGL